MQAITVILKNKKVGNSLQSSDYAYNIRGSLIKMNDPSNLGTKLFGYELKYFNPQNSAGSTGEIQRKHFRSNMENFHRRGKKKV